jgi:three-Cys-motif partner protein
MTRRDHFRRFEDHTLLKHFLLGVYLKQWATIHIRGQGQSPPVRGFRLWVVDALAGAGQDDEGTPGSPVIAAEIARQINAEYFQTPLPANDGLRVIAFESDPMVYARLSEVMMPYVADPPVAFLRPCTLQEKSVQLLRHVQGDPVFFFIDPFGVDGLNAALLPRLLAGSRAEILLLFSDVGAVRLAGKAGAVVPTRDTLIAERRRNPSLFGDEFDSLLATADRLGVDRVLAGHLSNARAREILNAAFGGDWWQPIIEGTIPELRQSRFIELYEGVLKRAGATHVLRFDVATEAGQHKYTLLHASKHKRAFAAMKDAMDRARRQRKTEDCPTLFEQGEYLADQAVTMDSGADLHTVVNTICLHFAGREVRWTGKYSDDTVRSFTRDETPLLVHEFDQLQRALERRGYVAGRTPLTYRFPPV